MSRYDYFISHHQADSGPEASLLAEALRNQGYRVFLDVDTLGAGDLIEITSGALEKSRALIVLVGPNFGERVRKENDWVRTELQLAYRLKKRIVPVLISGADFNPERLPEDLRFIGTLRYINFDRGRVHAVTEELREAFGFRPRASQGPGILFQILLVLLAIFLGLSIYRGERLDSDLKVERQRREDSERRENELKIKFEELEQEFRDYRRSDGSEPRTNKSLKPTAR